MLGMRKHTCIYPRSLCILYGASTCSTGRGEQGARRWRAEETSHAVACTTRAGVGGSVRSPANKKLAHICVAGHAARCASVPPNLQQCSCVHRSLCVRSSSSPPSWGRVINHPVCCSSNKASSPEMAPRLIVRRVSAVRGSCGYVVRVHAPPPVPRQRAVAPVTRLV